MTEVKLCFLPYRYFPMVFVFSFFDFVNLKHLIVCGRSNDLTSPSQMMYCYSSNIMTLLKKHCVLWVICTYPCRRSLVSEKISVGFFKWTFHFFFFASFPSLTCIQTSMLPSSKTFYMYFLADVVPMLCERAGLPPGTPVKMFEVRKNAVTASNPFFPKCFFSPEFAQATFLCVWNCRK